MKKVFNWTFGSMFRTFGRFIAFALLGCLLGFVLNKLNISLSDILGFEYVKADTLPFTSTWVDVNQCEVVSVPYPGGTAWDFYNCQWDTNNYRGNSIQFGSNNGHLRKIEFNISDTGDYEAGTYQVDINWGIDPRVKEDFENYGFQIYYSRNNDGDTLAAGGCVMGLGDGRFDYNLRCSFSTTEKFDRVKISIQYKCTGSGYCRTGTPVRNTTAMSYNTLSNFIIDDSASTAINHQTTIIQNNFNETNQNINNINDSINNDDVDESSSEYADFFSDFSANTHGLTGIITAPLNAIQSLSSKTCSPLVLPLPFVNQNLTLPCMRSIYDQYFGNFMIIYDIVTLGIVSYWVCVRIFALVKDFKNPDHDEVEVMDL